MNATGLVNSPSAIRIAADELDHARHAHLRHQRRRLPGAEHAKQLLRPVLGKSEASHDAEERIDVGGEASQRFLHDRRYAAEMPGAYLSDG